MKIKTLNLSLLSLILSSSISYSEIKIANLGVITGTFGAASQYVSKGVDANRDQPTASLTAEFASNSNIQLILGAGIFYSRPDKPVTSGGNYDYEFDYNIGLRKTIDKLTFDVERKGFEKSGNIYGEYDVFTNDPNKTKSVLTPVGFYSLPYNYNETKVNFSQKINHSYKLTMDFPSDEEYIWLAELITSPQIYAQFDDMYYPIVIKNTNYEYSKHQFAGLKPLEIDIDLCQTRTGFRR